MAINETRAWAEHAVRWSWMVDRRIDRSTFLAWYNAVIPKIAEAEAILEWQIQEVGRVRIYEVPITAYQSIITRGYGLDSKIITRGYGFVKYGGY